MADTNSPLSRFTLWRAMLPPALRVLLTVNVATYVAFVVLSIGGAGALMQLFALPGRPDAFAAQPWSGLTWGVANQYGGFFGLRRGGRFARRAVNHEVIDAPAGLVDHVIDEAVERRKIHIARGRERRD